MFARGVSFDPDRNIPDLAGRVIIVTGSNAGLGLETVRQLAKHNPRRIYLAARSKDKVESAIKQLKESNPGIAPLSFLPLDLSSFQSIKTAVNIFKTSESRLDILVNNAGIMATAEGLTKEGYEVQFGTNHMGHALLIHLLLPTLQQTARATSNVRVVTLSSSAEKLAPSDIYKLDELKTTMHERGTQTRYSISKIANVHYTSALAEHYQDIQFITVHPGIAVTNLHHEASGFLVRAFLYTVISVVAGPVEKGALNQLWASTSPDARSGEYYAPVGVPGKGSKRSRDPDLREQLWTWTQDQLKSYLED